MRYTTKAGAVSAALVAALAAPVAASAADGWYVGASAGLADAGASNGELEDALADRGWTASTDLDDRNLGGKIYVGVRLHPNFSVEGGYLDLGEVESDISASVSSGQAANFVNDVADVHPFLAKGIFVQGVGRWPVRKDIEVFGKAGLFRWEAEGDVSAAGATAQLDKDGTDPAFGVGAQYRINNQTSARLEWERFDLDGDWANFVSVGVVVDLQTP